MRPHAYRRIGPRLLHRYGRKSPGMNRRGQWVPALGYDPIGNVVGPMNWFGKILVRLPRRRR